MSDLDPRALEAAAEAVGRHIHYSRQSHNCHRCRRTAESAITAYLAVTQPTVETAEGLEGLPVGTVVVDKYGDVCEKRSGWWIRYEPGLIDTASMVYALPARVIWRPHD